MRALIVLAACLAFAGPAYSFGHFAAAPAFHGGAPGHVHRGHGGLGFLDGALGPVLSPPLPAGEEAPIPAPQYVSGPACVVAPRVALPPRGPHIIYIGHQPKVSGPKIIYGTD